MEERKKTVQQQEKLSYEELKKVADSLSYQNQQLMTKLNNFDITSFLLSMLFKVMDNADQYDYEFRDWCKKNIQSALVGFVESITPPEQNKDEDK